MKNLFKESYVAIQKERYPSLLIFIAPSLNFLSGITFDLHAPSLPAIAQFFGSPIASAKNTITIALFGFSLGCILFGILLDFFGRRPVILVSLIIYTFVSFAAIFSTTIETLLLFRFLQGFSVSALSIGCRTIIIDNFHGYQFKIALLYTSLAFGIGPIIAPFVGGFLQFHFGWKANFIAYGTVSFILTIVFGLFIVESKTVFEKFSLRQIVKNFQNVLKQTLFIPGILISGISQIQLLVYTTTGAFIVEYVLHRSSITYGNSALIISCGYLLGTLTNRFLIPSIEVFYLISMGFLLLFLSVILQVIFSILGYMNLVTLILPITLIGFSNGFIFINILTICLQSVTNAGVATAVFTAAMMVIGTIGTYIINQINVNNLAHLAAIFGISALIQLLIFLLFFRNSAKEKEL